MKTETNPKVQEVLDKLDAIEKTFNKLHLLMIALYLLVVVSYFIY